jgi:hypothetical protein
MVPPLGKTKCRLVDLGPWYKRGASSRKDPLATQQKLSESKETHVTGPPAINSFLNCLTVSSGGPLSIVSATFASQMNEGRRDCIKRKQEACECARVLENNDGRRADESNTIQSKVDVAGKIQIHCRLTKE